METRDRTIDALRAIAIVGVVAGHWLVSAVVSDPSRPAAWHGASPLAAFPALTPATWVLQTLGLFFFAGGFAAARSHRERAARSRRERPARSRRERAARGLQERATRSRRELAARTRPGTVARFVRLARPVGLLAAVWLPAWLLLKATGAPDSTLHVVRSLLVHPLWFLIVYLILTVIAPLLRAAVGRFRLWPLVPAIALVAACDVARHLDVATWLHPLATVVGWAVPYLLGIALADGSLPRRAGRILAPAGVMAGAALVLLAGYPASAVGVPGDGWSNLDPPSLFALALAAAQIGVFLLVRDRLAGWLRRPVVGAPVAVLNRSAMTVYCWHQSALLLVTFGGLLAGPLPGLSDPPAGMWPLHRLLWLPVFAVTLVVLCAAFHRAERVRTWRRPPR
ncbi:acyltransferase [Actinoplanes capillaceus]|uniref:Acyltransferase n=1 Tax=Actinoplanes campanulatus TaxID=113559 RepID=A0ABQ3WSV5_9ACTN|nr:acyltransferase [Actinoplanes capillaceus]GID49344.1 acyltransferase [Actinoplanes capillaceus]